MSKDKQEYDRLRSLLDGKAANVLDSSDLKEALLEKVELKCEKASEVYLFHDPSDIRKEHSEKMEHIGKVRSLDGKRSINGYKTFNSVVLNPKKKEISLVFHQTYSTAEPDYVKESDVKLVEQSLCEDAALIKKVKDLNYHNTRSIYKTSLQEQSSRLKAGNASIKITHISDREFDDSSLFKLIDKDLGDDFISRLKVNRNSNEEKMPLSNKGKTKYKKLIDKSFANTRTEIFDKIRINNKIYQNVKRIIEWEDFEIEGASYKVVRITLIDRTGAPIFKQPMLLLTNKEIKDIRAARKVYRIYLMRTKIEMVFKFCKNNLGWEDFQIRDFESIKNLLALVFFIAAYFYEIKKAVIKNPTCIQLAKIGGGKGKTTLHFILNWRVFNSHKYLKMRYLWQKRFAKCIFANSTN